MMYSCMQIAVGDVVVNQIDRGEEKQDGRRGRHLAMQKRARSRGGGLSAN